MKCALIGEKLGHSYSKIIHNRIAGYNYDLVEVKPEDLEKFVKSGQYDAFNVTIPYKQAIIPYLDGIDYRASEIGAVNTVFKVDGKYFGCNTDYDGMIYMLARAGIELNGKKVMILGSGGTGKTATAVAKKLGASEITIVSRKGPINYSNCYDKTDTQVIINTTPVGMYPYTDIAPVDLKKFRSLEALADVIYNPLNTRLVLLGKEIGIKCTGGLPMLVAQAKYAYDAFTLKKHDDGIIENVYNYLLNLKRNVILIGMPGSGKSSIGKAIAKRECKKFIDTDYEIVAKAGKPVSEIFSSSGEVGFRKLECMVIAEKGKETGAVISTGGGAVLNRENYYSLKANGKIYYIERDADELATRGRPLSSDKEAIHAMAEKRLPLYREFADYTVKNDGEFFKCVDKIREDLHK